MTHDLMRDLLNAAGLVVERVVITDLREGTFYAEIHLRQGDQAFTVSSRPSDAMALAARTGTPIYAEDALLDAEGVIFSEADEDETEGGDPDELVDQFKEFIEGVRPEDFTS
jgi:bifunctional DNase/RNase